MSLSTSRYSDAIPYEDVAMEKINLSNIIGVPIDAEVRIDANTQLIDILDALTIVLGNRKSAQKQWERYCFEKSEQGKDVSSCSPLYWRKGGHPSAVAPAHVIVQIINQLNSKKAAHFRAAIAKDFCRKLGGDLTLANEIIDQNAEIAGTVEQSVMLNDTETTTEEANTGKKRRRECTCEIGNKLHRLAYSYEALKAMDWMGSGELHTQFRIRVENLATLLLTDQSSNDSSSKIAVTLRPWTAVEIACDLHYKIPCNGEFGLERALAKAYREFYEGKEPREMTQTNKAGERVLTKIYSTKEREECIDDAVHKYFESL